MKLPNPLWILVILVLLLIILLMWSGQSSNSRIDELLHRTIEGNNITQQWRRSDSAQVTQASANYITADDLRNSTNATVDSIRKDLVGPIRRIERVTRIIASRMDSLAIPVHDTVRVVNGEKQHGFTFNYAKPPYLTYMSGYAFGDSLHINYGIKSEYTLQYEWAKTGLFKPKELKLTVLNKDPAVNVDRIQQFQIVTKVPFYKRGDSMLGIGLLAGFGVSLLVK